MEAKFCSSLQKYQIPRRWLLLSGCLGLLSTSNVGTRSLWTGMTELKYQAWSIEPSVPFAPCVSDRALFLSWHRGSVLFRLLVRPSLTLSSELTLRLGPPTFPAFLWWCRWRFFPRELTVSWQSINAHEHRGKGIWPSTKLRAAQTIAESEPSAYTGHVLIQNIAILLRDCPGPGKNTAWRSEGFAVVRGFPITWCPQNLVRGSASCNKCPWTERSKDRNADVPKKKWTSMYVGKRTASRIGS